MRSLKIIVSGRVQGVFFRKSTRNKAESLGIYGFVKNQPDGKVYIEAEGEAQVMEEFIRWCRIGPPTSQVTELNIEPNEIKGFSSFEIR